MVGPSPLKLFGGFRFSRPAPSTEDVDDRARAFLSALDVEAKQRRVALDQHDRLRRIDELVLLPDSIEALLGPHTGDTLRTGVDAAARLVLNRWGLRTWEPTDVARWLRSTLPSSCFKRSDGPDFLRRPADAVQLLGFCAPAAATMMGIPMLLGTDDVYYPIGGPLARPSSELAHLLDGLERPLVDAAFRETFAGRKAPWTDAAWLLGALRQSESKLIGKRVPTRAMSVIASQSHVDEALEILTAAQIDLQGVPLAIDNDARVQSFHENIVCGLPLGEARAVIVSLAKRVGLEPVHHSIDKDYLRSTAQVFTVDTVLDRLDQVPDWDAIVDSRLLIAAVAELHRARALSPSVVERLRLAEIWAGDDGLAHALTSMRLPARTYSGKATLLLVADELVGERSPTAPLYMTFNKVLEVDILDSTEEIVLACEHPPEDTEALRTLLDDLGDANTFSASQLARLRSSAFVLCRDGSVRRPADVLVSDEELPLSLGDRRVDSHGLDRRTRPRLIELGGSERPSAADLVMVAQDISKSPVGTEPDPGRVLWEYLTWNYDKYSDTQIGALAAVPWLTTNPGPRRSAPNVCLDPGLSFANILFPVPINIGTPRAELRERLGLRASLDVTDYVRLAESAATSAVPLVDAFFSTANTRCTEGSPFERGIAPLRTMPIIPISDGGLIEPSQLVAPNRTAIWQHLRQRTPTGFATRYPNLARCWGLTEEGDPDWHDHLDVLAELMVLPAHDERDARLAADRLASLAGMELTVHQIETVRRQALLPTSLGLRRVDDALRSDVPPSVRDQLRNMLPLVDEREDHRALLDALSVRSVSSEVLLEAVSEGTSDAGPWTDVLKMHGSNVLRCIRGTATGLDTIARLAWPPSVVGVTTLSIRAMHRGGGVITEWESDAFLDQTESRTALLVKGSELDARAVVDALATAFGIDSGKKSLLRAVLISATEADGARELDWENVAPLDAAEVYVYEPAEPEINIPVEVAPLSEQSLESPDDVPEHQRPTPTQQPSSPASQTPQLSDLAEDVQVRDQDQSPRGTTHWHQLEAMGIEIVDEPGGEVEEVDYTPEPTTDEPLVSSEVRVCLSFYDVFEGTLPIADYLTRRLTSGIELDRVILFDEEVPARRFGSRHVKIEDGARRFVERRIVAGTIVHLYPNAPGAIEISIVADPHSVDGVWMLELDEAGNLTRLRQDDVELAWETDDAFYRAERRLEDIEALRLDGGKSAKQLIIEAFKRRPGEGLSVDDVWGLVAISRLFAKATIESELRHQTGLYELRSGLWYMTGTEVRRHIPSGARRAAGAKSPAALRPEESAVLATARRLARQLSAASLTVLRQVAGILDIDALIRDRLGSSTSQTDSEA